MRQKRILIPVLAMAIFAGSIVPGVHADAWSGISFHTSARTGLNAFFSNIFGVKVKSMGEISTSTGAAQEHEEDKKEKIRDEDRIMQMNNLTVVSVSSSTTPGTIVATTQRGNPCMKFQNPNASAGVSVPCPMMPTREITIKVNTDTLLLLRNRTRGTMADFAAGDKINVFGFLASGEDTAAIDALIVRNVLKGTIEPGKNAPTISSVSPASASAGTIVAITGTGFTPTGNRIKFENGFVGKPYASSDGKTIQFRVPSWLIACDPLGSRFCVQIAIRVDARTHAIAVINGNGTSNTANLAITEDQY